MQTVDQSEVPSSSVLGSYDCRKAFWLRAKKLKVVKRLFTIGQVRGLHILFDERLENREPTSEEYDGILDLAAKRNPFYGMTYERRRNQADRDITVAKTIIDQRCTLWLKDEKSWESLAHAPLQWDKVIAYRRDGIGTVTTLEMLPDQELSKINGIGPARLKIIRAFCLQALKEQEAEAKQIRKSNLKMNRQPNFIQPKDISLPIQQPALF